MGIISTNSNAASKYSSQITGKVAAISGKGKTVDSGDTNLTASKNCDKCYDKKDTMMSAYSAIAKQDALNIAKIDTTLSAFDMMLSLSYKARG